MSTATLNRTLEVRNLRPAACMQQLTLVSTKLRGLGVKMNEPHTQDDPDIN